jgi:hypothetical protein
MLKNLLGVVFALTLIVPSHAATEAAIRAFVAKHGAQLSQANEPKISPELDTLLQFARPGKTFTVIVWQADIKLDIPEGTPQDVVIKTIAAAYKKALRPVNLALSWQRLRGRVANLHNHFPNLGCFLLTCSPQVVRMLVARDDIKKIYEEGIVTLP